MEATAEQSLDGQVLALRARGEHHEVWKLTVQHPIFVRRVRGMAHSYARRMYRASDHISDAVQEGYLEAAKAAAQWDPELGPYLDYAVSKARAGVTKVLGENGGLVRLPKSTRELLTKLRSEMRRGKTVDGPEDVQRLLEVGKNTALRIYRCLTGGKEESFDNPVNEKDDRHLSELIGANDENYSKAMTQDELEELLTVMKSEYLGGDSRRDAERNWSWFLAYHGIREGERGKIHLIEGKTYQQIADESGVKKNVVHSAVQRLLLVFRKRGYFKRILAEALEEEY